MVDPETGREPDTKPAKPPKEKPPTDFPGQCSWANRGKRCLLRGVWSPSTTGPDPIFCAWHGECTRSRMRATERREFDEWIATQAARESRDGGGTFANHKPADLWQAVLGETALPRRTKDETPRGIVSRRLNDLAMRIINEILYGPDGLTDEQKNARLAAARKTLADEAELIRIETEAEGF